MNHSPRQKIGDATHVESRPPKLPKIGLALGGGVARGWAHIGVLRALLRLGIEPDIICGTSVGALVGGAYLIGKLDVLEDWVRNLTRRRVLSYLDFRIGNGGLIGGERLAKLLHENFGDRLIEDLDRPFVAVCGELATGHEIWIRDGSLVDAIRASYALPGVFAPIKIHDRWLIDGALVNPVPISVCRAFGARLVIGVTLHGDAFGKVTLSENFLAEPGARPDKGKTNLLRQVMQGKARPDQLLMRQLFGTTKDKPGLSSVMLSSLNIIMDRLARARLAGDPADVLVTPKLGHIGLLDFDRADETIRLGEEAMMREATELQESLALLSS